MTKQFRYKGQWKDKQTHKRLDAAYARALASSHDADIRAGGQDTKPSPTTPAHSLNRGLQRPL